MEHRPANLLQRIKLSNDLFIADFSYRLAFRLTNKINQFINSVYRQLVLKILGHQAIRVELIGSASFITTNAEGLRIDSLTYSLVLVALPL